MIDTKQCKGCLYRSEEGWCVKSYVTGKCRTVRDGKTVIFPPDHICEGRVPGKLGPILKFGEVRLRINHRKEPGKASERKPIERNPEVKRLYDEGASDRIIADALGLKRTSVTRWRLRHGYPCNPQNKKEESRK